MKYGVQYSQEWQDIIVTAQLLPSVTQLLKETTLLSFEMNAQASFHLATLSAFWLNIFPNY